MSNKVDKLFKEKLEGDSLQPSAQAWEKVEAHLTKKNKMVLWARVAAALMLLGLLTFVGVNWNNNEVRKEIVKEEPAVKEETEQKEQNEQKERNQEHAPTIAEKPQEVRKPIQKVPITTPVQTQALQEQLAIVPEPQVVEEVQVDIQPDPTTHNSQPTTQKGITLTYSLPPVKKREAPQEPQVAEQKKTGFERVMEIAKEVKNGEALGELRQAKDDIFALDFRKDKNKKQ